jgi:hypothetical protein
MMMLKKTMVTVLLAVALVFGLGFAGCSDDSGGGGGGAPDITTPPAQINGFYGVTSGGKTIQVIITPAVSLSTQTRTVSWALTNTYQIKVAGIVVSQGTITNISGTIEFTPTDGSTVTATPGGIGLISAITVVTGSGTSYNGSCAESTDYYYMMAGGTTYTKSDWDDFCKSMSPGALYDYCMAHTEMFGDGVIKAGTWEEVAEFGIESGLQSGNDRNQLETTISQIRDTLNSEAYAIGFFPLDSTYIYKGGVFYVSRLPLN